MRALGILFVALALASPAAFSDGSQEAKSSAPKMAVEPASFDFGRALQRKVLKKEFSIKNFGNADLVVENVSTTCGCTAALLDDKVIKPGRSAVLRVTLETRESKGSMVRSVLVKSNDPEKGLYEIKVQATVIEGEQ